MKHCVQCTIVHTVSHKQTISVKQPISQSKTFAPLIQQVFLLTLCAIEIYLLTYLFSTLWHEQIKHSCPYICRIL